jgi:thiol:disulfide interchange protein/DsbC/DsbD-like thiol-disulfide interchange protein
MRASTALAYALIAAVIAGVGGAREARGADAAPGPGPVPAADGKVQVSLVTDVESAIPGHPFWVGLRFQLAPGWHLYWKNPGQSGMATELTWSGDSVALGPTRWPAPERIVSSDGFIVTYGWHGDVVLLSEARTTAGGTVRVSADFLVCEVECIPGSALLSRRIEAGDGSPAKTREVMAASWARVPRPAADHGVTIDVRHDPPRVAPGAAFTTTIAVTGAGASLPQRGPEHAFFPERTPTVTLMAKAPLDGGLGVILAGTTSADDPGGDQRIAGVLALEKGGVPIFVEVEAALPRGGADIAAAAPTVTPTIDAPTTPRAPSAGTAISLGRILLLCFLGGLLLNLMPCVLPVLAIKVGGLVRLAGDRPADRALHAAAYGAGIVASMLVLAVAVLIVRAATDQVGWGMQFQQPVFLIAVGALLVVLAVNAFGGLEIGVGADALTRAVDARAGLARSAGEGVLAVVLATPCSAPFLGTGIGAALVAPPAVVVLAFVAAGLGLAAPFVLLTVVPGARRLLPKPGPWMLRLKQVVGFALLGAAMWLGWILGRGFGVDAAAGALAFWLAVAVAAWIVGATMEAAPLRRAIFAVAAVAIAAVTGAITLQTEADAGGRAARVESGWEPWSEDAVAAHLGAGRPVFVDFTADWCLTCKVNERTVLATDEVKAAVDRHEIALLKADWTVPDPAISAALRRFGKAGVPMYLVYSPARPTEPEVLPELLTPSLVTSAFATAAGATAAR